MKKLNFYLPIFILSCLMTLNINISTLNPKNNDLSLENIKALQAVSGEVYCDQCNDTICKIVIDDISGISTGNIIGSGL